MHGVFLGLAALACPVGMGVMMWFMTQGMRLPSAPSVVDKAPAATIDEPRVDDRGADKVCS